MTADRTYRGWTITRIHPSGYWLARKLGELNLKADTFAGIRQMIRDVESGAYKR